MNPGYMIYQAERTHSSSEQREIDRFNSEMAAAVTRPWHRLGAALAGGAKGVKSVRSAGRLGQVPGRTGEPQAVLQKCL
jgi:hypothetical protein